MLAVTHMKNKKVKNSISQVKSSVSANVTSFRDSEDTKNFNILLIMTPINKLDHGLNCLCDVLLLNLTLLDRH